VGLYGDFMGNPYMPLHPYIRRSNKQRENRPVMGRNRADVESGVWRTKTTLWSKKVRKAIDVMLHPTTWAGAQGSRLMRTNRDDIIRGAAECTRAAISAPCRICGARPAPHLPKGERGAFCGRHCPACTVQPEIDFEAVALAAELD
jgi:hypothetical protein